MQYKKKVKNFEPSVTFWLIPLFNLHPCKQKISFNFFKKKIEVI